MYLIPPINVVLKNGEAVVIRALTGVDGSKLADLYESVPREDARFFMSPSTLIRERAELDATMTSFRSVGLVIEDNDGRFAGYAYFRWKNNESPASHFGICIRHDFQGFGAGKHLMNRLLEVAREIGPPVMSLHVQKANDRALALYQKMGFSIVYEQIRPARDGFDAEPEYYMERCVR